MLDLRYLLCALAASVVHLSVSFPLLLWIFYWPSDTLSLIGVLAWFAGFSWTWFKLANWLEFVTSGRRY